jgi:hypothetical protein
MSLCRVILVAFATLFTVGMTSFASAECCGWGYSAPTVSPLIYGNGCGGCAAPGAPAPIAVGVAATPFGGPCCSWNGCGNCGWGGYGSGCSNCGWGGWGGGCGTSCGWGGWGGRWGSGGCGGCSGAVVYNVPIVNQGPVYGGPGITVPYSTYSPDTDYAPAADYPYVPGYGAGYGGGYGYGAAYPHYARPYYRHYAYRGAVYPRYYGTRGYYGRRLYP